MLPLRMMQWKGVSRRPSSATVPTEKPVAFYLNFAELPIEGPSLQKLRLCTLSVSAHALPCTAMHLFTRNNILSSFIWWSLHVANRIENKVRSRLTWASTVLFPKIPCVLFCSSYVKPLVATTSSRVSVMEPIDSSHYGSNHMLYLPTNL